MWGHLLGALLYQRLESLQAKLAQLIIVNVDELHQRRDYALNVFAKAMTGLSTNIKHLLKTLAYTR